jgi:hypothetical protein
MRAFAIRAQFLHPCHLDILSSACSLQNVFAELSNWKSALACGQHVAYVCRYLSIYSIAYTALGISATLPGKPSHEWTPMVCFPQQIKLNSTDILSNRLV